MDTSELDAALSSAGWHFDAERERFSDGARRIDFRRILELIPGMTMEDLAGYVTRKHEEWLTKKPPME